MRFPIGLAALTDRLLGKSISKCPALTDWSRRPLSEVQRRYAATDAQVVLDLTDRLMTRLPETSDFAWVLQAGQDLVDRALALPDPDRAWKTLEIASRLDDPTRRVLHHVHSWRERVAREKGQPPHYVLSDGQALQISRNRPSDIEEMSANRRLPSGLIRRHGPALLETIQAGMRDSSPAPAVASLPQCQSARLLRAWAEIIGPQLGIAAELLLPWELALRVIRRPKLAWTGWRLEATGASLQDFLSGRVQIQMGRKGPRLV
jgi:ribonuclease D